MFCTKCGAFNDEGSKFCGSCGASLDVKVVGIKVESEQVYQPMMGGGKPENKKKKGAIIAAVAIVLAALIAAGFLALRGISEKNGYDDLVAKGHKFYEEMDYESAEAMFLEAISVDPKKADAYLELADVYIAQGEPEKAEEILDEAEENVPDNEDVIHKKEEIKNYVTYEWVVEPKIEADNIFYVKVNNYEVDNDENRQKMMPEAVIENDGLYGLIDMSGKMLSGFEFNRIEDYYGWLLLTRAEPKYEAMMQMEWNMYQFADGEIYPVDGFGGGMPYNSYYYYNGIQNTMTSYVEEWGDDWGYIAVPRNSVAVIETNRMLDLYEDEDIRLTKNDSKRYGIYSNGNMVTGFEYEQCGSVSDGLHAAKKDGKWGYVDASGKVVIPFEYDASWNYFEFYENGSVIMDYGYSATEGFVVLNKDGRWSIRNTEGKLVLPEGIFQQICPVYEGKCWVKQNGKWGVIELVLPKGEKIDNDPVDFASCVENMANDPLQVLEAQDYDSDGRIEAFAITGGFPDENGIYYPAQIWFVDADGNCTLIEGDTYGMVREQVVAGEHTFFVWEMTAMGSSSCSFIYGVKNGEYYSSDISGMYGSFGGFDGNYSAIADNWDSGYHQYDAVYFEFQEDEFIEIGREENVW